jgi:ribosomal protein L37AE/L43A
MQGIPQMASCPKCGKHPLRKDQTKTFRCKRCGVPGGALKVLRNGEPRAA